MNLFGFTDSVTKNEFSSRAKFAYIVPGVVRSVVAPFAARSPYVLNKWHYVMSCSSLMPTSRA